MTLGAVDEDRDGEKVIPNRALAILEDRSRRNGELIAASRAFPELAGRESVDLEAAAFWTVRPTVIIGPPDLNEFRVRSSSDMRATALRESVRAAAERRKCSGITTFGD